MKPEHQIGIMHCGVKCKLQIKGEIMDQYTFVQEPPTGLSESERQYFFMNQAREKLKQKELELFRM